MTQRTIVSHPRCLSEGHSLPCYALCSYKSYLSSVHIPVHVPSIYSVLSFPCVWTLCPSFTERNLLLPEALCQCPWMPTLSLLPITSPVSSLSVTQREGRGERLSHYKSIHFTRYTDIRTHSLSNKYVYTILFLHGLSDCASSLPFTPPHPTPNTHISRAHAPNPRPVHSAAG